MTSKPDVAWLDQQLERLLEQPLAAREQTLAELTPETAALLRRMLAVVAETERSAEADIGLALKRFGAAHAPPAIPGLRMLEEIGRGGMAVVYAAERDVHGVAERVAVKVLASVDIDEHERQRFLDEQRILAELKHPNIATLLDVGLCEGRAYMVMERIDGVPIDAVCALPTMGLAPLLDALLQVADALQAAHERLVIHRDIKPGNVLVDARGQVKLIDFGIAKRLDGDTLGRHRTVTGAMPLTLRYASPEQLLGRSIGVASDLYQLGLLCYVLLSGAWPFDQESEGSFPSERIRAEAEPVPPSRRVSDARLRRQLEGDLDSIVLKCLRFDPAERYRSIGEFVDDIHRFRERLPVRARRQTRVYRLQRFVARHRLSVIAGAAALLLLVIATTASVLDARRQRSYAERSEALLGTLTEVLSAADPFADHAGQTPISTVLDRAEAQFLGKSQADPDFQMRVLLQLAGIRESLREYQQALRLLERAQELASGRELERELRATLLLEQAEKLTVLGRLNDALDLLRGSDLLVPVGQADATELAALLAELQVRKQQGDRTLERERLPAMAERVRELPSAPAELRVEIAAAYARTLTDQGSLQLALQQFELAEKALAELERADARWVQLHFNRAVTYALAEQHDAAAQEYQKALALAEARAGREHPVRLVLLTNYGSLLLRQRLYEQAYQLLAPLLPQAAQIENPRQRSGLYDAVAVAALQTGRAEAAILATLERLRVLAGMEPEMRADIRPDYAAQTAWLLFEVGDYELAQAYAEHRGDGGPPAASARVVSLISAELLGRTSPFTESDLDQACARVQYRALRSVLVLHQAAKSEPIPVDCNPQITARLQTLGLTPQAKLDPSLSARISVNSPLLQRALKQTPVTPLASEVRQAFRELLVRFADDALEAPAVSR